MVGVGGALNARGESQSGRVFFANSHLPLKKWLLLLHFWIRQFSVTTVALDADIHKSTAIDVYQWFHEVCTTKLLNTQIMLGGNGAIVDETLFHHKPKVSTFKNIMVNTLSIINLAASSGPFPSSADMGVWDGGCFSLPRPGIYGGFSLTGCNHTAAHNQSSHGPRNDYSF